MSTAYFWPCAKLIQTNDCTLLYLLATSLSLSLSSLSLSSLSLSLTDKHSHTYIYIERERERAELYLLKPSVPSRMCYKVNFKQILTGLNSEFFLLQD